MSGHLSCVCSRSCFQVFVSVVRSCMCMWSDCLRCVLWVTVGATAFCRTGRPAIAIVVTFARLGGRRELLLTPRVLSYLRVGCSASSAAGSSVRPNVCVETKEFGRAPHTNPVCGLHTLRVHSVRQTSSPSCVKRTPRAPQYINPCCHEERGATEPTEVNSASFLTYIPPPSSNSNNCATSRLSTRLS